MEKNHIDIRIIDMYRVTVGYPIPNNAFQSNHRFLDEASKRMLWGLEYLTERGHWHNSKCGLVIATESGPNKAVEDNIERKREKGYVGINPSYFPYIMPSSQLVYGNQVLNNHEIATVMFTTESSHSAMSWAAVQLYSKRCETCCVAIIRRNGCVFILVIELDMLPKSCELGNRKSIRWRVTI